VKTVISLLKRAAFCALLLAAFAAHAQNLITNGSFEMPALAGSGIHGSL
jgi:hypothetical protein